MAGGCSRRRSKGAILLHQVLDDVRLVVVDPSREGHEQHLQRGRSALIGRSYPDWGTGKGPDAFSDTTGTSNPFRAKDTLSERSAAPS
jgi:hypothetical protein